MMRSPRVVWVEEQIRQRYHQADILDVGFVGPHEEPALHKSIRSQNPTARVVGVDINCEGVYRNHLANTIVADAATLPFTDASFDCVLFLEIMEHVFNPYTMLREFARVLRPTGSLILTTPNAWEWWRVTKYWLSGRLQAKCNIRVSRKYLGSPHHLLFYDPLSLINILYGCGFQTQHIATKNHTIPFLGKYVRRFSLFNLQFYPMNRLGGYTCLVCTKRDE